MKLQINKLMQRCPGRASKETCEKLIVALNNKYAAMDSVANEIAKQKADSEGSESPNPGNNKYWHTGGGSKYYLVKAQKYEQKIDYLKHI